MKDDLWLIFNRSGFVKALRQKPENVQHGEVLIRCKIELPKEAFDPYVPEVTIKIGSESVHWFPIGTAIEDTGK